MKTSNRLIFGALGVILIGMTIANFTVKKTLKELKIKENSETTQQPDTILTDTTTNQVDIKIK